MTNSQPNLSEQEMDRAEAEFPASAHIAFSNAYNAAVAAGLTVVISENGKIFAVEPDGRRTLIKTIAPPVQVVPGTKYKIP